MTKFSCGGICIGFGVSHALFDGFGAFNFLASWAHISRSGKDETSDHHDDQFIIPNHSRQKLILNSIISRTSTPRSSPSSSIYEQDHVAAIQDLYGIPMQAMASDDGSWESELAKFGKIESQLGLQLLTLCVKKEVVETWKESAVRSGKLAKCSTFDVLCAHVWKVCLDF